MGETASYQRCVTLNRLGRCLEIQGRSPEAATYYRQAIAVAQQLEPDDGVKRRIGALQSDLAIILFVKALIGSLSNKISQNKQLILIQLVRE